MATPESSNQNSPDDLGMLQEYDEEFNEMEYQKLCARLFDLGIDKSHQQLFTISAGDTRLRVFARSQTIGNLDSGEERTVQRIIVNRLQNKLEGGPPTMLIDDYLVDLAKEATAYKHTVVDFEPTNEGDGDKLPTTPTMAPVLWQTGPGEVALLMGWQYENIRLPQNDLHVHDVITINKLLLDIEPLSIGWRDEDIAVKMFMYQ